MSDFRSRLPRIRLIGFDVDGVFTDGRFYLSDDGVESKCFNTQDGYGVRRLLAAGIEVAVVSGRASGAVSLRMDELGVGHVILGSKDKVGDFSRLAATLSIDLDDAAFVGDDIPDLALLDLVGTSFAVANAVAEVAERCDYVTRRPGGMGAIREISDLILDARAESAG